MTSSAIKPRLVLGDGNAFAILGRTSKAAKRAGMDADKIREILSEMKSGDYDHLLATVQQHFDVVLEGSDDD